MAKQNDLNRCYRILGLKPGASLTEVKQAYRKLVKTEHPDFFNHDPLRRREAEEKFRQISEAYVKLRNSYQPSSTEPPFNLNRTAGSSYRTTSTANTSNQNSTNTSSTTRTSTQTHNASNTSDTRSSRPNDRRMLPVVASVSLASAIALLGVTIAINNFNSQQNSSSQNPTDPQENLTPETTQPETATPQPSPPIAALTLPPQQCRTIAPTIGDSARIFAQPSRNADTGKRIPQDTKVTFIGGMREFVEIQLPDKSKGWIFNDQLYPCAIASDSQPEIAQITAPQKQCLTIAPTAGKGARIFSRASRNAAVGKRIPKDTKVTLLAERQEFAEIQLSDGYRGWIFNDQAQPCQAKVNNQKSEVKTLNLLPLTF